MNVKRGGNGRWRCDWGLHASTVSQAPAEEHGLLPCGRTIPLDNFFDRLLHAEDLLCTVIARERHAKPLNGPDPVARLNARGRAVACRTNVNDRDVLDILILPAQVLISSVGSVLPACTTGQCFSRCRRVGCKPVGTRTDRRRIP